MKRVLYAVSLASLLATGCQTLTMDARSGASADAGVRTGGTCERAQNSRSECEDRVGCAWSDQSSRCVAH